MPQPPEVLTGMRDPQDVRMQNAKARESSGAQAPSKVPVLANSIFTVYESQSARYRIQITSPDEFKDPQTGLIRRERPLVAQFENGRFINAHRDPAKRAMIDSLLQENPYFGLEGHFWLKSAADERDRAAMKESAKRTVGQMSPEEKRELLKSLVESGDLELDLPPKKPSTTVPPELGEGKPEGKPAK